MENENAPSGNVMQFINEEGTIEQLREEAEPKTCIFCGELVPVNIFEQLEHLEKIHLIKARHIRNQMVRTSFVWLRKLMA